MREFNVICSKLILAMFLALFAGCATSMKNGTSAKLRPDLTDDDTEIWEIQSKGNPYTSEGRVMRNAMERAALTSELEGYNCFFISNSDSDVINYSYTQYRKETLNTHTYKYTESTRDTAYSHRVRQQEIYVPQTYTYSEAHTSLYVKFMKNDECEQLKKTKWRQNVHFNKDILALP
ncbi:MAG: hypothetical protein LBC85_00380 [Fibromonadaceae bacterium]|jgi:hypothetical protein|nr:hypothetical protein [Fibromonadaceae bacterium]